MVSLNMDLEGRLGGITQGLVSKVGRVADSFYSVTVQPVALTFSRPKDSWQAVKGFGSDVRMLPSDIRCYLQGKLSSITPDRRESHALIFANGASVAVAWAGADLFKYAGFLFDGLADNRFAQGCAGFLSGELTTFLACMATYSVATYSTAHKIEQQEVQADLSTAVKDGLGRFKHTVAAGVVTYALIDLGIIAGLILKTNISSDAAAAIGALSSSVVQILFSKVAIYHAKQGQDYVKSSGG